jgi:crotonobetainyl-CoA:carnitine CoA-transferase CaiB-like acyl-CoA transferase
VAVVRASGTPFRLVAAPVQSDVEPAVPTHAPEFNEHADSILATLAMDEDAIIDLKVCGVLA